MSTVGATKSFSIDFDSVLADTMIAWTREYNKLKHTKESIRMFTCVGVLRIIQNTSLLFSICTIDSCLSACNPNFAAELYILFLLSLY